MAQEPRLATESIAGQRPYQEDAVLARPLSDGRLLVAVADGMGGHAAGEVASALALESLVAALEEGRGLDVAFRVANGKVHDKAREPGKQGMGTTLVAALVEDGEYFVANVGDSRGYLLSDDSIRQITDDHSFVAEAMKRGQSRAEAMATPWRDALTRSIGTDESVEVDVFGPFPVRADSALLICSDGLYKTLSDDDLRQIFVQCATVEDAARVLVAQALDRGSDDNISVAIVEYGEVPRDAVQSTMPMDFVPDADDDPGSVKEAETAPEPGSDDGSVTAAGPEAEADDEAPEAESPVIVPPASPEGLVPSEPGRPLVTSATREGPPWVIILAVAVVAVALVVAFLTL